MKLLTQAIIDNLPKLSEQEQVNDPIAYVKLLHPISNWTWYITEFDGVDECFGLVQGFEEEFGYFSLCDLESLRAGGFRIVRDLNFTPCPLSQVRRVGKELAQ